MSMNIDCTLRPKRLFSVYAYRASHRKHNKKFIILNSSKFTCVFHRKAIKYANIVQKYSVAYKAKAPRSSLKVLKYNNMLFFPS